MVSPHRFLGSLHECSIAHALSRSIWLRRLDTPLYSGVLWTVSLHSTPWDVRCKVNDLPRYSKLLPATTRVTKVSKVHPLSQIVEL